MSKYTYDARAYDERYRRVYEARAEFWEEPMPTEALVKFLFENKPHKDSSAIEIFDLEVSVGWLNLMTIQDARDRHPRESYRVLKNGCAYFSCNSVVDQSMSVEEFYENLGKQP